MKLFSNQNTSNLEKFIFHKEKSDKIDKLSSREALKGLRTNVDKTASEHREKTLASFAKERSNVVDDLLRKFVSEHPEDAKKAEKSIKIKGQLPASTRKEIHTARVEQGTKPIPAKNISGITKWAQGFKSALGDFKSVLGKSKENKNALADTTSEWRIQSGQEIKV